MATQTPAKKFKITYSAIGGNLDEIHREFDGALAAVAAPFGGSGNPSTPPPRSRAEAHPWLWVCPCPPTRRPPSSARAGALALCKRVGAAKAGQKQWAALPWQERVAAMRRAAENIREQRYEIAALMSVEVGKNRMESLGDAEESADLIDYYAQTVENNDGYMHPLGKLSDNEQTMEVLRPFGVFAVIAPFNFPLALATGMSSAALVAGNAVVFKPAGAVQLTGAMLARVYDEAGMPKGVFNLVYGSGATVGEYLINHKGIDGIAFTGSHAVGMRLLREFGAGGAFAKPCLGELGGKNAAIVTKSADLEAAAEGVMRSAFGLQGQKCSACSRVYVHKKVADAFMTMLVEKTKKLTIGDPTDKDVYMGPVINEGAVKTYEEARGGAARARTASMLDRRRAAERTGKLAAATTSNRRSRNCRSTTRSSGTSSSCRSFAVGIVDSFDQALVESNKSNLGLTGGLFSADEKEISRFFDDMEAGVLYVNRKSGATTGAWPGVQSFCGWKGSGITGKGGCGPFYVQQFMREQSRTRMT